MDFITLATAVIAYISLGITGGFLEEHGKEIYHKAKDLLTPDEMITLNLLEKYPENKDLQSEAATALETHLKANPDVAEQLEKLLETANQTPANTSINLNRQDGEINTNIQGNQNTHINLNPK